MTTKKKQRGRQRVRAVPKQYLTRSAELAANAADRYFVDGGGTIGADGFLVFATAHYGIRDRVTGHFYPRRTLTRSEVYDEVEQMNHRVPASDGVSRGKLLSPERKIQWGNPEQLSATEWVERLVEFPPTAAELSRHIETNRALTSEELCNLLAQVAESDRRGLTDETFLDRVSQQLLRKFGVRRGGRWGG